MLKSTRPSGLSDRTLCQHHRVLVDLFFFVCPFLESCVSRTVRCLSCPLIVFSKRAQESRFCSNFNITGTGKLTYTYPTTALTLDRRPVIQSVQRHTFHPQWDFGDQQALFFSPKGPTRHHHHASSCGIKGDIDTWIGYPDRKSVV